MKELHVTRIFICVATDDLHQKIAQNLKLLHVTRVVASYSVKYRLSACINYQHPRLWQILREITDLFTVLEQILALQCSR